MINILIVIKHLGYLKETVIMVVNYYIKNSHSIETNSKMIDQQFIINISGCFIVKLIY